MKLTLVQCYLTSTQFSHPNEILTHSTNLIFLSWKKKIIHKIKKIIRWKNIIGANYLNVFRNWMLSLRQKRKHSTCWTRRTKPRITRMELIINILPLRNSCPSWSQRKFRPAQEALDQSLTVPLRSWPRRRAASQEL